MSNSYFPESLMGRRDLFALFYRRKWVLILAFAVTGSVHSAIIHFRPPLFEVRCLADVRAPNPSRYGLENVPGLNTIGLARRSFIPDMIRSKEFDSLVSADLDQRFVHLGKEWQAENFIIEPSDEGEHLVLSYESQFESTQPILAAAKRAIDRMIQRGFTDNVALVRSDLAAMIDAEKANLRERNTILTSALENAGLPKTIDSESARADNLNTIALLESEIQRTERQLSGFHEQMARSSQQPDEFRVDDLQGFAIYGSIRNLAQSLVTREVTVHRLRSTKTVEHPEVKAAALELEEERRLFESVFEEDSPFYPEIRAAIQQKKTKFEDSQVALAADIAVLEAKRAEYEQRKNEHRAIVDRIDANRLNLRNLTQQRDTIQSYTDSLIDAHRRLKTFEKLDAPSLRLLSNPGPAKQTTAKTSKLLGLVILLSIVFSVGVGYVMESVDHRIHDMHVLRRLTDLPILGSVPMADTSAPKIASPGEAPAETENFNAIVKKLLTNLDDQRRVVVISGPDIDAGKSYVASNLAIAAGRLGLRTLLVDADLRQPRMYNNFGVSRFPGLSGWLDGTERGHRETLHKTIQLAAEGRTSLRVRPQSVPRLTSDGLGVLVSASDDATSVTQQSGHASLSLITSGLPVSNPGILLQSSRMSEFIAWARASFDLCLIDSPPLRLVADTLLIAGQADGSVLVARAGQTSSQDLKWACEALGEVDSRLVGTVLNGVPFGTKGY